MRFQLRTLLEQLPSPDNIYFRSLLILSQVTPQAPLLVVSMPLNYIMANHPKEKHQTLIRDRKRNEANGLLCLKHIFQNSSEETNLNTSQCNFRHAHLVRHFHREDRLKHSYTLAFPCPGVRRKISVWRNRHFFKTREPDCGKPDVDLIKFQT